MRISRRELLKSIPAFLIPALMPSGVFCAEKLVELPERNLLLAGSGNNFCVIDLNKKTILHTTPIGFYPHSFVVNPVRPDRVWAFQRHHYDTATGRIIEGSYTSSGVEVDIATGEITQRVNAAKGSVFRGHGLITAAGDVVFIARVVEDYSKQMAKGSGGYLTGYDIKTGKVVADYLVSHTALHECKLQPDGTAFAVTGGILPITAKNTYGAITRIDLQTGRQLSLSTVAEAEQRLAHFQILKDGTIFATAQTDEGVIPPNIYMGREGEMLKPLAYNAAVPYMNRCGMLFSNIVYEGKGLAAVVDMGTSRIILVDLKKQELLKSLPVEDPWGVVVDKKREKFIITGAYLSEADSRLLNVQKIEYSPVTQHGFTAGHSLFI